MWKKEMLCYMTLGIMVYLLMMTMRVQETKADWLYTKPITVSIENQSFDYVNYPINITINTTELIDAGNLRGDKADLRMLTEGNASIDFVAVPRSGGLTDLWFLFNNTTATTTRYYVRYSNPSASFFTNTSFTTLLNSTWHYVHGFDFDSESTIPDVCPSGWTCNVGGTVSTTVNSTWYHSGTISGNKSLMVTSSGTSGNRMYTRISEGMMNITKIQFWYNESDNNGGQSIGINNDGGTTDLLSLSANLEGMWQITNEGGRRNITDFHLGSEYFVELNISEWRSGSYTNITTKVTNSSGSWSVQSHSFDSSLQNGTFFFLKIGGVTGTGFSRHIDDIIIRKNVVNSEPSHFVGAESVLNTVPLYHNNLTKIVSPVTYTTNQNYGFQINWTDTEGNFNNSIFESNFSGTVQNYTLSTSIAVQNSSVDIWWINFTQEQFKGAYTFYYKWYGNDTNGLQNSTEVIFYVINKATPVFEGQLDGSVAHNQTGRTYGNITKFSYIETSSGDADATVVWKWNNTQTSETTLGLPACPSIAYYCVNVSYYYSGGVNYTGLQTDHWLNISKAGINIITYANGSTSSYWIKNDTVVNVTVTSNISINIGIKSNTTIPRVIHNSTNTVIFNISAWNATSDAVVNITGYANETQNYTANQNSVLLYVDITSPAWFGENLLPAKSVLYTGTDQYYNFTISWNESFSEIEEVILEFSSNETITSNISCGTGCYNFSINKTGLTTGTYNYKWYARDNVSNWNVSDSYSLSIRVSGGGGGGGGGGGTTICGDGICGIIENEYSCPQDCRLMAIEQEITPSICGNNICESAETFDGCPQDCKIKGGVFAQLEFAAILLVLLLIGVYYFYWVPKVQKKKGIRLKI